MSNLYKYMQQTQYYVCFYFQSASEPVSIIPPGNGHNRTGSVPSLVSDNVSGRGPPPGGYGKPNVAPKPPSAKPAVPTKNSTLTVSSNNLTTAADGRSLVSRAQSMRIPRTPPVAPNNQRTWSQYVYINKTKMLIISILFYHSTSIQ